MSSLKHRELDPKLRRLVAAQDDSDRLRAEVARGAAVMTAEIPAGQPVPPEAVEKRVLVRLVGAGPPAAMSDLQWIEIVEGIWSVGVPVARLTELADLPEVEFVEAGRQMSPSLETSVPETRADRVRNPPPPAVGLDGTGVVVGIIDFGLDFTLDDFRNADGTTRVAFLWDQLLTPAAGEGSPGRFGYGVEYGRAAIDAALAVADPFARVRHAADPGSHGTHVAGIAAGNGRAADAQFGAGRFVGVAPGATLIFVQPSAADANTTFTDSVHVTEAIAYVFEKAAELGLPCAINMSLGQNGGSHDGESLVERAIDRLLEQPGRAMVVAAGNEHIWRGHASGTFVAGQTRALGWKSGGGLPLPQGGALPPGAGDFTPNEMEVWFSSRDRVRVRLAEPGGEVTAWVAAGETETHTFANGDQAFIDSERFTVLNGDSRIFIEASPGGPDGRVATGTWRVELDPLEVREGRFDAWIERDARRSNNQFADQSFFVGADFDAVMTLGTPATTRRGVAVANYDHVVQAPSSSSSRGTTRDGRRKPEVAAPGTDIVSCHARGGRPGPQGVFPVRLRMSGTSMAAPHVAGIAAMMLQRNPRLTAVQVAKILIAAAAPPAGVTPFDNAWGFGKVNAEAALALVEA